jgi:hypothetical protein
VSGGLWATIAPMVARGHGLGPPSAGLMGPARRRGHPGSAACRALDGSQRARPVVLLGVSLVIAAWCVFALGWWPTKP